MSGDHSADPLMGCGAGEWRSRSARMSAKQRLHRGDFVLAALDQDELINWMLELEADWRPLNAIGRHLPEMHEFRYLISFVT